MALYEASDFGQTPKWPVGRERHNKSQSTIFVIRNGNSVNNDNCNQLNSDILC